MLFCLNFVSRYGFRQTGFFFLGLFFIFSIIAVAESKLPKILPSQLSSLYIPELIRSINIESGIDFKTRTIVDKEKIKIESKKILTSYNVKWTYADQYFNEGILCLLVVDNVLFIRINLINMAFHFYPFNTATMVVSEVQREREIQNLKMRIASSFEDKPRRYGRPDRKIPFKKEMEYLYVDVFVFENAPPVSMVLFEKGEE
jgi:hypothetical protein